ncbi:hypothetical protein [Nonomuraea sp. NPDC049709]
MTLLTWTHAGGDGLVTIPSGAASASSIGPAAYGFGLGLGTVP